MEKLKQIVKSRAVWGAIAAIATVWFGADVAAAVNVAADAVITGGVTVAAIVAIIGRLWGKPIFANEVPAPTPEQPPIA